MDDKKADVAQEIMYAFPNVTTPSKPVTFDPEFCNGCNQCVEVCQVDVYISNPEDGQPPIILHPDECWYCGCCVIDCPCPGAIQINWPIQQRGYWKRKATGEIFRV